MDDSSLDHPQELSVRARLERLVYLADERCVRENMSPVRASFEVDKRRLPV